MAKKQIVSPLPGVFYHKPAPDAQAFKRAGEAVAMGDVIGLVEVMKSFHEITADSTGTVTRYLIDNEAPVTAGQPVLELSD